MCHDSRSKDLWYSCFFIGVYSWFALYSLLMDNFQLNTLYVLH